MKNKKDFYLTLLLLIASPLFLAAGVLVAVFSRNNRAIALGGILICIAAFCLLFGIARAASLHAARKTERKELVEKQISEKFFQAAFQAFQNKPDHPEKNTLKIVDANIEFFAEGRYVCEKDFKNISGYHFAFEINSTELKSMPDDYDDVCDLKGNGILISAGYFDGEPLEEYANDSGVILQEPVNGLIGQTIALREKQGYAFSIRSAEEDEIDYGFVKILKYENEVLTISFFLNVPWGLSDRVEGTVELKKDVREETHDVHSIIKRIKHRRYNAIVVSDREVRAIQEANAFLPESYLIFLREVGFVDFDWIDLGRNENTPTNLNEDETGCINEILADHSGWNVDDFYFIGVDNADTYYAFSKNPNDKKVYVLSNDATEISSYETFEEFLTEILRV